MTKTHQSKVSYGLLTVLFVVFFSPLILILLKGGGSLNTTLLGLFLIIVFGLITHMFFKTAYRIEENQIKIKCGFITYKPISINDIKEITKSNNIISSPAASFDRIEIKYGKFEEILLSPKNKLDFAEHLTKLNPEIKNNLGENKSLLLASEIPKTENQFKNRS